MPHSPWRSNAGRVDGVRGSVLEFAPFIFQKNVVHATEVGRRVGADRLSAAASALGVSLPTVSRVLAELERELGARLVARTTRALPRPIVVAFTTNVATAAAPT